MSELLKRLERQASRKPMELINPPPQVENDNGGERMRYWNYSIDLIEKLKDITVRDCQFDVSEWCQDDVDNLKQIINFLQSFMIPKD